MMTELEKRMEEERAALRQEAAAMAASAAAAGEDRARAALSSRYGSSTVQMCSVALTAFCLLALNHMHALSAIPATSVACCRAPSQAAV